MQDSETGFLTSALSYFLPLQSGLISLSPLMITFRAKEKSKKAAKNQKRILKTKNSQEQAAEFSGQA